MKKYRIGIVGTGGIAHSHLKGYRKVAGDLCEVVAGCDPDSETLRRYCDQYDVPLRFSSAQEMIASGEIDVLSLLTPPAVRGEVIFPAVENGIHLLVEKPFGETLADAESFVLAAEQAGVQIAVNQELRFFKDMLRMKELLEAGTVGEIRFIAHDQFQDRTLVKGWRADEKRLEISIFSIHLLDRIRWLAGCKPRSVSAVTRAWNPKTQGETFAALTIQFEGDLVGTMVSNWHSLALPECRLRIDGTEGSLLSTRSGSHSDDAKLRLKRAGDEEREEDCTRESAFIHAMGESMRRLVIAATEGKPAVHGGRDNLDTMAIVDAAYLSAERGGTTVTIEEVWPKLAPVG